MGSSVLGLTPAGISNPVIPRAVQYIQYIHTVLQPQRNPLNPVGMGLRLATTGDMWDTCSMLTVPKQEFDQSTVRTQTLGLHPWYSRPFGCKSGVPCEYPCVTPQDL